MSGASRNCWPASAPSSRGRQPRGIGAAIVRLFIEHGAAVAVLDRDYPDDDAGGRKAAAP